MISISKKISLFLLVILIATGCKPKRDPVTGKIIRQETNVNEKAKNSDGILFTNLGKKKNSTTYDFATSNPLWRATLNSLDFMPLSNISYSGGVITTDWYSNNGSSESIKIAVRFLSDEVKVSSVKVDAFKKTCVSGTENCNIVKNPTKLNQQIKEKIIEEARNLKVKDELKKAEEKKK